MIWVNSATHINYQQSNLNLLVGKADAFVLSFVLSYLLPYPRLKARRLLCEFSRAIESNVGY